MDAKVQLNTDAFSCSICKDLLNTPVTIPCGHSYCMSCVDSHWNGQRGKQSYSCPQCKHSFTQRPVLVKNTMLAVLMEGLKKSGPPAAAMCPSAAHEDVFCDLCSGKKVTAVKSCLQCLVSYCKEHLQPHYDVAALKKHKLMEPIENLQENLCSRHDEAMKMFCRTDQQCICYLCSVDQHKGHHTVTAAAERADKQRELQAFEKKILHRLDHKQKEVALIQHQVENCTGSADAAVDLSNRSLKELVALLEKRISEVKQQVRSQEEAEEHRVKELQDKVQLEITKLKKTVTELGTLSQTENHVHFLHKFASLSKVSETSDSVNRSLARPPFQDMVTVAVSKLRSALQETSLMEPPAALHKPKVKKRKNDVPPAGAQATAPPQQTSSKDLLAVLLPKLNQPPTASDSLLLQPAVNHPPQPDARPAVAQVTPPAKMTSSEEFPTLPQPKISVPTSQSLPPDNPDIKIPSQPPIAVHFKNTRELREYVRDLTMDPQSLNDKLILSHENHLVQCVPFSQDYSHNAARFLHFPQVVSKQVLTGRCSWMVDPLNSSSVTIAVAYKSIKRSGPSDDCCFGKNAQSWALESSGDYCVFWHNSTSIKLPQKPGKIVVFLDCNAGILSFFYRMDNELHHIHTVRTTFTKPLVAGLRLGLSYQSVKLCGPEFY